MSTTNAVLEYRVAKPKSGDTVHRFEGAYPQDVELVVEKGHGEVKWYSQHHDEMARVRVDASSAEEAVRHSPNGHGVAFVEWSTELHVLRIVYR